MNLYLVACLVLSAVLCRTEGCCSPDQWEGHIGEFGGIAHRSSRRHHEPELVTALVNISYDATNKKVAVVTARRHAIVKQIADFSEHKAYIIQNTTCNYFNLTAAFQKMCTDNATQTGSAFYGGGSSTILVNTWSFQEEELQVYASTTKDGCIPVGESLAGRIRDDYMVLALGFYNITTGIKDPSIFNPPSSCQPGRGDIISHLDGLGVSQGMKHMATKFSGKEPKAKKYLRYEDKFKSLNQI